MEDGNHTLHSPNGEGKVGRVLERARKDRGLSLEEAERATKIRKRYLVGLEDDDYTVLPDAVYARGFLKTYANFLGLDGAELSRELKTRRKPRRERGLSYEPPKSEFERPIIYPGGVSGAEKRKVSRSTVVTVVVSALVIAALIGALYFVGLNVRASAGDET
ncbi:MAG: helix-turn-helix domain-containing protein, partial [Rubrobacter sp.]|nr:helix-turn-helix domain-containing protein [Rubrobacter sp.]